MNKIRNLRHKSPSAVPADDSMPPGEDHVRGGGLFNKIKRYSNASHKLIRRSNPSHHHVSVPRKHSPHRSTCGSYDMTGDSSRDLRPEIGAPVLITTTALDIDKITPIADNLPKSVIPLSSSESDTEIFADASASLNDFGNIKFSFFENGTIPGKSLNLSSSTEEGDYEIVPIIGRSIPHNISLPEERLETIASPSMRKNKILSKSVGNLNSPRDEGETTIRHPLSSVDIPVLFDGDDYDSSGYYNEPAADDSHCSDNGEHSNATHNKAARNANTPADKQQEGEDDGGKLTDFKRSLSAIILHQARAYEDVAPKEEQKEKSVAFQENEDRISHKSFSSVSCLSDDFDLKSASFEDLKENRQLFLSVEEFNALTKEIHENEEFNNSITMIDQEYCDHRSNLRPNQRRVTLMRNKTNKIHLNLNDKRGKITSVWSGIKHWIDEERGKIKEVVQRHSAMQRVGANLKSPNKGGGEGGAAAEEAVSPVHKRRSQAEKNAEESTNDLDIAPASAEAAEAVDCNVAGGVRRDSRRSEERDLFHTLLRQKSKTNSTAAGGSGGGVASAAEEGQNGFEELRRYVKQGGDFGKDLAAILQERLEAEHVYSKSLSKMALKLNKTCREIPGSLAEAWRAVATEMESRGEVHRQFSKSLTEEIVKPLKEMVDGQHKTRKTMENTVDKSARLLSEWRQTEAKSKKTSHAAARENEKLQDNALDVRISRSPSISLLPSRAGKSPEKGENRSGEKDSKLDVKRRKAEESVKRADVEYYQLCVRAERARVDWEMDVLRSSSVLQTLETSRLQHMKGCIASYLKLSQDMCPLLGTAVDRLAPTIANCNVQKDMNVIKNIRRASEGPSEQLLPDFYCEHTTLAMNRERRKQALIKLLQLVRQDLERERRSRNGLRGISQQLNSSADSQSITDKLYHIRSMLTYLEGTRYKIQSTLLELDHKQRGTHPLAPHIQLTRDRNGLQQSILKVPLWLKTNEADGTGSVPVSANDDEYVNQFIEPATADVRNDAVIGSYTPVYNRSHSQLEMKSPCQFTAQSLTDAPKHGGVSNRSSTGGGGGGKAIDEIDRGIADGGSNQHDSDFDEFSSHDEAEDDDQVGVNKSSSADVSGEQQPQQKRVVIGRCRAMYSYTPKLYDELELEPGDIIEVHTKEETGWWLGELKNRIGIFPATYVEELHA